MAQHRTCRECGLPLPVDAPGGACPVCSLQTALRFAPRPAPPEQLLVSGAGHVPTPEHETLPRFGDYELIELVARGGMGVVYKARQVSLNRTVALKMIQGGVLAGAAELKRFHAEAEAIAHLQHPNIVAIHEVGEHEGQPYFSMDYVEGKPLSQVIGSSPLPARRAAGYLRTIAEAIHYAHEQGILHRDLKPANVLIDLNDQPHVMDFGLARRLEGDSELTVSGQVLGSPNYMPPEQATGKRGKATRRSDVYALGAILYHALTGRPPFVGEGMAETVQQVLNLDPAPLRVLNPSVPADVETICLKCLEKDPARRYPSAQALAEDLGRFLEGKPVRARPVGPLAKTWRWCGRNPRLATAVGLAVLSLVLGLGGVSWQWRRAEAARVRAQANAKKAQTEAARSAQVAQFMKEMLAGVDPNVAQGRDTRVLQEILDQTAERLAKDLTNQPEVQAELLLTIGTTFLSLGEFTKAEALTREAVRLRKSVFGETNALVADSFWTLAAVLARCGTPDDTSEAEGLLRQALAIQRRLLGDEHLEVARSLVLLASTLNKEGKRGEAEAFSREALRQRRKLLGSEHLDVAQSLGNLAGILRAEGKLDEAEGAYRQALEMSEEMPGAQGPGRAYLLRCLANLLVREGQHTQAEPVFRQSLEIARKVYGEGNIYTEGTRAELGYCLSDQHKFVELATLYRESLAILRTTAGNDHPQVATSLEGLADALRAQGNLPEAEPLYRECLAIREKGLPDDYRTFKTRAKLGATLLAQKNYTEAEPLLLSGCEGMSQLEGKRPPGTVSFLRQTLQSLVRLYRQTQRPEQAAEWEQKLADFNQAQGGKKGCRQCGLVGNRCRPKTQVWEGLSTATAG